MPPFLHRLFYPKQLSFGFLQAVIQGRDKESDWNPNEKEIRLWVLECYNKEGNKQRKTNKFKQSDDLEAEHPIHEIL